MIGGLVFFWQQSLHQIRNGKDIFDFQGDLPRISESLYTTACELGFGKILHYFHF